jgi:low affinity Fe/Cu permease
MRRFFTRFASRASVAAGHYLTFMLAVAVVLVWAVTGPLFHFSDTWQLVINTGTTIVTFLMVFLIQHTQNRDALAMHLKLDELLRSMREADDSMIGAEESTDEDLEELKRLYGKLAGEYSQLQEHLRQEGRAGHAT